MINEFSFWPRLKHQPNEKTGSVTIRPPPKCREPHEGASTLRSLQRYLERRPATSCHRRRRKRRNETTKRTDLNYKQQKSTGAATVVVFFQQRFLLIFRAPTKKERRQRWKRCSKIQVRFGINNVLGFCWSSHLADPPLNLTIKSTNLKTQASNSDINWVPPKHS